MEVEVQAAELGWTPKEQWVEKGGSEDKWRTAEEFMEFGERNTAFVRKSLEKDLKDANASFEQRLERMENANAEALKSVQNKTETERKHRIQQWEAFRNKAASEDNLDDYNKSLVALNALQGQAPAPVESTTEPQRSAESIAFHDKLMPLIGQNKDVEVFSDDAAATIRRDNPNITEGEYFTELKTRIEERFGDDFPQFFGRPAKRPSPVESSDGETSSKGTHSYADLPPEAKQACKEFVKDKLMTKADYVSSYFGE